MIQKQDTIPATNGTHTLAEARKAIEDERTARITRASERLQAILEEERCQLVAVPIVTPDGRIVAQVQLQIAPE